MQRPKWKWPKKNPADIVEHAALLGTDFKAVQAACLMLRLVYPREQSTRSRRHREGSGRGREPRLQYFQYIRRGTRPHKPHGSRRNHCRDCRYLPQQSPSISLRGTPGLIQRTQPQACHPAECCFTTGGQNGGNSFWKRGPASHPTRFATRRNRLRCVVLLWT